MAQYVSKAWLVTINAPREMRDDDEKAGEWLAEWYEKCLDLEYLNATFACAKGEVGCQGNQHIHALIIFESEKNKNQLVPGYRSKGNELLPVADVRKCADIRSSREYVRESAVGGCKKFGGDHGSHGDDCECKCVWYFEYEEVGTFEPVDSQPRGNDNKRDGGGRPSVPMSRSRVPGNTWNSLSDEQRAKVLDTFDYMERDANDPLKTADAEFGGGDPK